jgi:hypothetical protein
MPCMLGAGACAAGIAMFPIGMPAMLQHVPP